MAGIRRAKTSYDVYDSYEEQLLDDAYPVDDRQLGGAITPQMYQQMNDGRMTPVVGTLNGRNTPANGRLTPRAKSRTLGRPQTRAHVSVQTEPQRNYHIPDMPMRPTSPVQRLLDRSATQPMISLESSPGGQMDPFTRQYYHRVWRSQIPTTEIVLNRHGRAGGVWRHVRACIANTGSHLAFIDGTVKQEDNVFFPAFPKNKAEVSRSFAGIPTVRVSHQRVPSRKQQRPLDSVYSQHARDGFKYWYQEPKPIDSKMLARRQMILRRTKSPKPKA